MVWLFDKIELKLAAVVYNVKVCEPHKDLVVNYKKNNIHLFLGGFGNNNILERNKILPIV